MEPILTIWGPVPEEGGPFDPEWEYRRLPDAQAYLRKLRLRIKDEESRFKQPKGTK